MQGPVRGAALISQTVEQRLAAVEGRLASLEKLLVIATDGGLTIRTATKISLQAPTVEVKTGISLQLHSGANIDVKAGAQLSLNGGANTEVKGGSQLSLSASGSASLKAATVSLNGGTKPLARLGDTINGNMITAGAPTVFG